MIATTCIPMRPLSNSDNSRYARKFFVGFPRTRLKRIALHGVHKMTDKKTNVCKPLSHWLVLGIMFVAFVVVLIA